jgi:hypothetical protein
MATRAELEFRSRACLAQLKLRIVAFSIVLAVPPWIAVYTMQKMGLNWLSTYLARAVGLLGLAIYMIGIVRIYRRTQRDCDLVCPNCNRLLGPQGGGVNATGDCRKCGQKVVG